MEFLSPDFLKAEPLGVCQLQLRFFCPVTGSCLWISASVNYDSLYLPVSVLGTFGVMLLCHLGIQEELWSPFVSSSFYLLLDWTNYFLACGTRNQKLRCSLDALLSVEWKKIFIYNSKLNILKCV